MKTRLLTGTAVAAIAALLLSACGKGEVQAPPAPEVTVATPLKRQVTDWDEYTGRLEAVESVEVRPRVSGYVQDVRFTDGTLVKSGDLLFVIDQRPYQAVLDEAKAQLTSARIRKDLADNDLDRARRLFEARAVSEEELDARTQESREARASIEAAEAAVQAAALDLGFCEVRAPIGGRIGRKLVTAGNLVTGGTKDATLLTTIVSVDPMHVYFTADERAYLRYQRLDEQGIRPSSRNTPNPVRIQLADEQGFPHVGRMDFVDNSVDEATGTMQGRAIVPNPEGLLTPGLFARVQLLGEGPYEALLVPDLAIGTDQAQRIVFTVGKDNVVTPKPVELGRVVGTLRVIRSGLEPSDQVIINGLARVRPGAPVTPVQGEIPEPDARSLGLRDAVAGEAAPASAPAAGAARGGGTGSQGG